MSRSSIIVFVQSTVMFYRVYPLGFHVLAFALFCSWGFINQLVIVKKIVRSCSISHGQPDNVTSRHGDHDPIFRPWQLQLRCTVYPLCFNPSSPFVFQRGQWDLLFWTWSVWLASAPWSQHNLSTPISGKQLILIFARFVALSLFCHLPRHDMILFFAAWQYESYRYTRCVRPTACECPEHNCWHPSRLLCTQLIEHCPCRRSVLRRIIPCYDMKYFIYFLCLPLQAFVNRRWQILAEA